MRDSPGACSFTSPWTRGTVSVVQKSNKDNKSVASPSALMNAKLIYVLSSFHMPFCAFYIHIHVKLIKFPLNLVL